MRRSQAAFLGMAFCLSSTEAVAEPMILDAVLSTTDQFSLGFKNDSRRFVTLLQREGSAAGGGVFEGAKVVEYGMHDITSGESAKASGYLEASTTGGDIAYFEWRLRAFFVAGPDGNARVANGGQWELIGGTGQFANLRGVGTMRIEFVSKTDRRYIFEGDLSPAP